MKRSEGHRTGCRMGPDGVAPLERTRESAGSASTSTHKVHLATRGVETSSIRFPQGTPRGGGTFLSPALSGPPTLWRARRPVVTSPRVRTVDATTRSSSWTC